MTARLSVTITKTLLLFRKETEAVMRQHDLYKRGRGSPDTTEDDGDDDFGEGFDIDAVKPAQP